MLRLNLPSPVVVIVGPTAVGKTDLALRLAERLTGEIVSVDSRLFYRGMDIGTAKPSVEERARVPHHLIDVTDPDHPWSLSMFQQAATQAVADIHSRGKLPFLVGGTGQYVRAVIEGWELPAQEPEPALRDALERWGKEIGAQDLHRRLAILDPQAAELIDWRNMRRTIRALEVTLRTGRPFSGQRLKAAAPFSLLMIGLMRPRVELYQRVDERIDAMLRGGFVDEVQGLLEKGYLPSLPALSAIGYQQIIAYLHGKLTLDEAVALIKRSTRRYVRHQGAWFGAKDPSIRWFEIQPGLEIEVENFILHRENWQLPGVSLR